MVVLEAPQPNCGGGCRTYLAREHLRCELTKRNLELPPAILNADFDPDQGVGADRRDVGSHRDGLCSRGGRAAW